MSKYRAIKVKIDGYTFDSLREGGRYGELKLLERAGHITDLQVHPKFPISINGNPVKIRNKNGVGRQVFVILDFSFIDAKTGKKHICDVKGIDTPVSRLKRALLEAQYGVEVTVER
jgi:hypothetical protein